MMEDLTHWISIALKRFNDVLQLFFLRFKAFGIWSFENTKLDNKMASNECWPNSMPNMHGR